MRLFEIAVLTVLMFVGWSIPLLAEEDTVEWLGNYKDAIQEAKRTGKPIFLEYRCEA